MTLFEYLKSYFLEKQHLSRIFDEKYLQFALFETLYHHYGDSLEYERQYPGFGVTNEIDVAVPWKLAIEVKWLSENVPNRARDSNTSKLAQKIANLCTGLR